MDVSHLPYIDEHAIAIEADANDVWPVLLEVVERAFCGPAQDGIASILGCAERRRSGPHPLDAGSTMPGFRVVVAGHERELALIGRHRFSSYALVFHLEQPDSTRSRLRAETRAAFPGLAGRLYRLLVIGTRGHVLVVRLLLLLIRRRSERHADSAL